MADIASVKPIERTIEIKHPGTGENVGIRVQLMSADDPRMKGVNRRIQDQRLQLESKGKAFKSDDLENNLNTICFKAMIGWTWYDTGNGDGPTTFNGEVPEFNRANVFAVLKELSWFENQIVTEISDEKAFFTTSPAT